MLFGRPARFVPAFKFLHAAKNSTIGNLRSNQVTWLHRVLWELLPLGGLLNEHSLRPLLRWLIRRGHAGTAMELLRLPLNRIGVRALFREASAAGVPCPLL